MAIFKNTIRHLFQYFRIFHPYLLGCLIFYQYYQHFWLSSDYQQTDAPILPDGMFYKNAFTVPFVLLAFALLISFCSYRVCQSKQKFDKKYVLFLGVLFCGLWLLSLVVYFLGYDYRLGTLVNVTFASCFLLSLILSFGCFLFSMKKSAPNRNFVKQASL